MRAYLRMLVSLLVSAVTLSCTIENPAGPVGDGPVSAVVVSPETISAETGDQITVTATPTDSLGQPVDMAVVWASSDTLVATVTAAGEVTAAAPGTASITASSAGKSAPVPITVVATGTGEKARAADAFVNSIGTNTHISYLDRVYGSGFTSIIKPKLARLGIRHLRDGGQVVNDPAWMELVYGRMQEIASIGPKFTLILSARGGVFNDASHVATLMEYAGPAVEAFEGPNEYDLSGRAAWATELRTFQQALFTTVNADPLLRGYPVLGPSIARYWLASDVGDLSGYMDQASLHVYQAGNVPMTALNSVREQTRVMNGDRPIMVTETGYHNAVSTTGTHPGVSERAAGRYIPRVFLEYFNAGIMRAFSYELIDEGTDPSNAESNFGLLRVDGSEKPAYVALANLIALLSDPGPAFTMRRLDYSLDGDQTNLHHTLLQKRDGRLYLILWLEVSSYNLQTKTDIVIAGRQIAVTLGTPVSRARVFVPLVSATPQSDITSPQQLQVTVADHPVVLELTP